MIIDELAGQNNNNDKKINLKRKGTEYDGGKSSVMGSSKSNFLVNPQVKDIKTAKSAKNINSKKFSLINRLKRNKFYLSICKGKTNDIYNKNKFLKKYDKKINETTINNIINKKIYFQKTNILLNFQDKVDNIINTEKSHLKIPHFNNQKANFYYNDIVKSKKIQNYGNNINLMKKFKYLNRFKCNLSQGLNIYISSEKDFNGLSNINLSLKRKNQTKFLENDNISRRERRRFLTIQIKEIPSLKINKKKKKDDFLVRKTKNIFKGELDWLFTPLNLLSIQELILRSEPFVDNINYGNKNKYNFIKKATFNKNHSLEYKHKDMNLIKNISKQLSIGRKFSQMNLLSMKKICINKNILGKGGHFSDYSLLNQKKFFKRTEKKKRKDIEILLDGEKNKDNEELSDYSNEMNELIGSKELEDIYFELITSIFECKSNYFIEYFEKNKKYIDINQQLIEGNTLLILSSREGNAVITKFLCEQGLEVNIQNNMGNTALHYAIANQFYSIADILTRFGAREDIQNNKGLYPWDCVEHNL